MLDLKEGRKLVKLARLAVERYFEKGFCLEKIEEKNLNEKRGIFVTIENYPERNLRGCIGFISPPFPLWEAAQRAALSSAFEDSRFKPLKKEELDKVIFEISVLTKPELIIVKDPKEYPEKIEIGRDGIILECGPFSGLLLPQVATQFNWDAEEFLENLTFKAGLTPDCIYDKKTKIFKFQAQIFAEEKPNGKVVELTKHSGQG